uniref:Uncharacterized protein n=1 Tax=Anopheles maculatus TaxID=74869 RepID=A0A182T6C1_9DIPT
MALVKSRSDDSDSTKYSTCSGMRMVVMLMTVPVHTTMMGVGRRNSLMMMRRALLANTGSLLERSVSSPSSSVEDDSNSRSVSGGSVVGARVDGPALNGLGSSSLYADLSNADGMLSLEPPNVDGLSSSPTSVSLELLECCV